MTNYKPSDLFVGIVDFFAVLLPGAVLTFALQLANVNFLQKVIGASSREVKWVMFVIASYLLGHFVFLVGAAFMDDAYDATYARRRYDENGKRLLNYVGRVKRRALSGNELANNFKWSRAFIRLNKPELAAEIDRLEADSKFFRSLTVLTAVGWLAAGAYWQKWSALALSASLIVVWILHNYCPDDKWKARHPRLQKWRLAFEQLRQKKIIALYQTLVAIALILGAARPTESWWQVVVCFAVMCLSAWRFADQRWKMTQTAYLYFVMLNQPEKAEPARPAIPQFEV